MATDASASARLTALVAVGATVTDALLAVSGPWEPASVVLGWTAVVSMAVGVAWGLPGGVATAAALAVVRIGIHGAAGVPPLSVVVSVVLLVAAVEAASTSFEARSIPMEPLVSVMAVVVAATAAGAGAGVILLGFAPVTPVTIGWRVAAVAAAAGMVLVVLGLQRRWRA